ncbi:MAG: hypothetical protein DMG57_36760 [Acidobacteria bacterium]|nr:MAG: hypothetical protein DMG57_36760 [Acidobacteriota bacterium]
MCVRITVESINDIENTIGKCTASRHFRGNRDRFREFAREAKSKVSARQPCVHATMAITQAGAIVNELRPSVSVKTRFAIAARPLFEG